MPVESSHGRGATRNPSPTRFNLKERVEEGEWLDQVEALDGVPRRRTTVTIERPRSILTRNSSPDIGFDRSINAFRGCEHGCIYCFARPTHAYHDLSPGVDFESRLFVKPNAAQLLHAATFGAYHAASIAAVHRLFPGRLQATGQTLYSSLSYGLGGGAGLLLAGWSWERLGAAASFSISAAFALAGAALVTWRVRV